MSERKVILVTGTSRGIGEATIKRFSEAGWLTAGCSRSGGATKGVKGEADFEFICDVKDPAQVADGVEKVIAKFGKIDVLVNNAGLAGSNPFDEDSSDEFWHEIINVNLNGTYYFCKKVLPHLPKGGRVINIASILALRGVPDQTAYCAAKHAVLGLTRALAGLLSEREITVNAICPGWVNTEMAALRLRELGLDSKKVKMAEPHEVAEMVMYLASSEAVSINGQAFVINGDA